MFARFAGLALLLGALLAAGNARADSPNFPQLAGYVSATSAAAGETLGVHVSTVFSTVTLRVFRVGVVDSLVLEVPDLPCDSYATPDSAWALGCGWPTLWTLTVPPEWSSGMYECQFVPPSGNPNQMAYAPFVVRGSPAAPNPIVIISTMNTYQAYNPFGGHSLYEFNSDDGERSPRVSFNRPYDQHQGKGQEHFEQPFMRWFEGAGFRADYATDVDLALDPTLLLGRRLVVNVGHSEYWAGTARDAIEAFVDTTGNVAAFAGNLCYYQVRYEDGGRTIVCYKNDDDPYANTMPESTTVRWRDPGVARPECALFGLMYPYCEDRADDSLLFAQPYSWISEGLESEVGHRFGMHDVGYEFDTEFPGFSPPSIVRLFVTPDGSTDCPQTQMSSYYERQPAFGYDMQGGGIFDAGTVQWSWGLATNASGSTPDPRLQLMTTNILRGLSQPLVVTVPGTAVIRATFVGDPPPPDTAVTVTASQMGVDVTAYDPVPLTDDGTWPDSAAGDGIWSGALPLPAGRRLPLRLAYHVGALDARTARAPADFWLADTQHEDSLYVRLVDSLSFDVPVVGVGGPGAVGRGFRVTPNPFFGSLRFTWDAATAPTGLTVLDVRGRVVAALDVPRGMTALTWDGRDRAGRPLRAGVYWAIARSPHGSHSLRVVKLR